MSQVSNFLTILFIFLVSICAALNSFVSSAHALEDRTTVSAICDNAAVVVSRESGVPLDVLRAISLTETGRKGADGFLPWPWTVNMEGAGKWFDDRDTAQVYVDRHFARGARSFDVGCFQINYRWHGKAFSSIEEMFEPLANARYAARFLRELYDELGDWSRAAGAYHSRTPKYARKYKARFDRIRASLPEVQPLVLAVAEVEEPSSPLEVIARINRYPLLQSGQSSGVGSLVPLRSAPTKRFIDLRSPVAILDLR